MKETNIAEGIREIFFGHKKASRKEINEAIELCCAASDYSVRVLCFQICVNMIAAAFGRCEFRTYLDGKETRDLEYWLWNVEPNVNQNSTEFLHKLITKLYEDNEALIIETGRGKLVTADSYENGQCFPEKQNEYTNVTIGDMTYKKTFRENDVLHLRLNQRNIRPVLDGIAAAHESMARAAERYFRMQTGGKMKVHIDTVEANQDGFEQALKDKIEKQVKPFFDNENAVLPEFDGYKYEIFGKESAGATRSGSEDIRAQTEEIFNLTARAFLLPAVLVNGTVEATGDAEKRFLSNVIDPLADQLQEEINRKRYSFEEWKKGSYLHIDTSSVLHFDIFAQAANVEKVIGSAAFTVNDVRRAAGLDEINEPWANMHFMTRNIASVNEVASAASEGR